MQISEYVSLGHPDKIADYISEYILDRLIEQDPQTRYALEVQIKDNYVTLGGEVTTNASKIDYDNWVREAIMEIGYTPAYAWAWGANEALDASLVRVEKHISQQSPDIAVGVNNDGWGDQGIMFGMAVNNPNTDYMPADYYLTKKIGQELYESGIGGLDIKTQVVINDDHISKVIVAIPLKDHISQKEKMVEDIVREIIPADTYELIINGTGSYVRHSSMGDCGTTGRKLAVDFYGGNCNVGGGSPWTKDGTKADLALNLLARELALKYVKESGVKYCKCGIGCCIGKKEIDITLWGENGGVITAYTIEVSPKTLIDRYQLDKPIFAELCRNGLFSRIK